MSQPKKVLIVGSKFGEIYLNAFIQPDPDWVLAGLLTKGSPRSRTLAKAFGIPLFTDINQLPDDIDFVCIVVRSSIVKGNGSKLAEHFIQQGTSVLQEHPVHPDEILNLQQMAKSHKCHYLVNSFYPNNMAGQKWITNAQNICRQLQQSPVWGQVMTSRQLLYSALDLLCQALEQDPTKIDVALEKDEKPLQTLRLSTPKGDFMLCLQKHLSLEDPDQHSLIMHHLILGWPAGYLTLGGSYGPVSWNNALFLRNHQNNEKSLYQAPEDMGLDVPVFRSLYEAPENWRDVMEIYGPEAVKYTLKKFHQYLDESEHDREVAWRNDYQLALSQLWLKVLHSAGQAEKGMAAPFKPLYLNHSKTQEYLSI